MCAQDYAVIWLKLHIAQAASNHFVPKTIICIPEHTKHIGPDQWATAITWHPNKWIRPCLDTAGYGYSLLRLGVNI